MMFWPLRWKKKQGNNLVIDLWLSTIFYLRRWFARLKTEWSASPDVNDYAKPRSWVWYLSKTIICVMIATIYSIFHLYVRISITLMIRISRNVNRYYKVIKYEIWINYFKCLTEYAMVVSSYSTLDMKNLVHCFRVIKSSMAELNAALCFATRARKSNI